jgi:hypothetical protein
MSVEGMSIEEQWMAPRGGTMLGMNRVIRGGRTAGYELLILRESESGLVLEAHPSGQAPAEFEATEVTSSRATFENPAHDFPRRIRYVRRGADSLVARADAGEGDRGFDFPYRRVACAE